MPNHSFMRKVSAVVGQAAPVVLLALAAGAGCGGPFQGKPECRRAYDACINHCADACEKGAARAGGQTSAGDMVNTWDGRCDDCVVLCRDQAERCDR